MKNSLKKNKCDFSYRHYREILNLFKKKGYNLSFFSEKPSKKTKNVYLRHDIDISLKKALQLAKIEYQCGVYSTYFIRFSSPFYNIFDLNRAKIIEEIINSGHQLGLHFDGGILKSKNLTKAKVEKEVLKQLKTIKNYFKISPIISFHRPPKFTLSLSFKKFINAYEPIFFNEIKYLSDSKGNWREGCVCNWLNYPNPPLNFQILTHPIWWGRTVKDPNLHLQNCLKDKFKYLDNSLYQDSKIYRKKIFEL